MFYQPTLMGGLVPRFDDHFHDIQRRELDEQSWVEWVPHWLSGADDVFDLLVERLPLRQRTGVLMYDQLVDEPRLTAWWQLDDGDPEPLALLRDMRHVLIDRYREPFDSIGFNLYRSETDSVAWHGDRHRHHVNNPVIAIVSVGNGRPLRLRPRGGGPSQSWTLGHGDLFVMGGACQHDWEHSVPKLSVPTGPRLSMTFRSR